MITCTSKANTPSLKVIIASAVQGLLQLLSDEIAEIRTNAAVALGKVASYLEPSLFGEDVCTTLGPLLKCISDPFPPARVAALVTIGATAQFFDNAELAMVVLPVVVPKLADSELSVRKVAYTSAQRLMERLNPAARDPWDMSNKDLKDDLRAGGVDFSGCTERQELIDLLLTLRHGADLDLGGI